MNYDQIRVYLMLVMLFAFGFIYSCNHAQAGETIPLNTTPAVKKAIADLGVLCITGQVVVVNPKSGDILQVWRSYKQPDGTYVALPTMCGKAEDGSAEVK